MSYPMMIPRSYATLVALLAAALLASTGAAAPRKGVSLDDLVPSRKPAARPRPVTKKLAPRPAPRSGVKALPPRPRPLSQRAQVILTVSRAAPGQFRTLAEALKKAPAGARIQVSPGTYAESLTLERPVELVSARPVEPVVLESAGLSCVTMRTSQALLRGFTLRQSGEKPATYTVAIPQGQLRLEACDLSGGAAGCIQVTGPQAISLLKGCTLRGGDEQGLLVENHARVTLEDCTVSNAGLGLRVRGESEATLRNCRINENQSGGIQFTERSRGVVESCDLRANSGSGVEILEGATPLLKLTRIHRGVQGVTIAGKSEPILDTCEVLSNSLSGISVSGESRPVLRQTRIYDQRGSGLVYTGRSAGTVTYCDVRGSTDGPCVSVGGGSTPTLVRCTIREARKRGIQIDSSASPTLDNCEIHHNGEFNAHISNESKAVLRNCRLYNAGGASVVIELGAQPTLDNCHISASTEGVYVWGQAAPRLTRCRIFDNKKEGLKFEINGLGTYEDCEITGNGTAGAWMIRDANPTFRRCRIVDGRGHGIFVGGGGRGVFEECLIARNARGNISSTEKGSPVLQASRVE